LACAASQYLAQPDRALASVPLASNGSGQATGSSYGAGKTRHASAQGARVPPRQRATVRPPAPKSAGWTAMETLPTGLWPRDSRGTLLQALAALRSHATVGRTTRSLP